MDEKEIVLDLEKRIPSRLTQLAKIFSKHNAELYIVGGFIRDTILGVRKKDKIDIDLASALEPSKIEEILKPSNFKTKIVNKKLGTMQIYYKDDLYFEHTTFRKDSYTLGYHSPSNVKFTTELDIDAKRRDFTINCIYYSILEKKIVDIYNGLNDIENKIIRCIESPQYVFDSDGLRILRLLRFYAQLPNFTIDVKSYNGAKLKANLLSYISQERITTELHKIIRCFNLKTNPKTNFVDFFDILIDLDLLPIIFKNTEINFENLKNNYKKMKKYIKNIEKCDYFIVFSSILIYYLNININDIEATVRKILSHRGLQVEKKQANRIAKIVAGYFEIFELKDFDDYITYIQKYYEYLEKISALIGLSIKDKSEEEQNTIVFDLEGAKLYMKLNDIPTSKKELPISGYDIKKNFPKIEPNKISEMLDYAFTYATKHYTLDKVQLLMALERKENDNDNIKFMFDLN